MAKNSILATIEVPADASNYTKGRSGRKIEIIAIHHMAGILSAKVCGGIFQREGRKGSSHYGIGKDGEIARYVDEQDTAWTNSNWDSNCKSITIETSNSKLGPDWKVSDTVIASLIKLVADIAKRYDIKLIKGKTVVWHSMYTATTCPGPYLLSKIDYIIEKANEINNPAPIVEPDVSKYVVQSGDTLSKIGARFGIDWKVLYEVNRAVIGTNANIIRVGQVLTIPEATPETKAPVYYVVKPGDNLSKIAAKYGTTWQKLYSDNRAVLGTNPSRIFSGQRLVIK